MHHFHHLPVKVGNLLHRLSGEVGKFVHYLGRKVGNLFHHLRLGIRGSTGGVARPGRTRFSFRFGASQAISPAKGGCIPCGGWYRYRLQACRPMASSYRRHRSCTSRAPATQGGSSVSADHPSLRQHRAIETQEAGSLQVAPHCSSELASIRRITGSHICPGWLWRALRGGVDLFLRGLGAALTGAVGFGRALRHFGFESSSSLSISAI